MGDWKGKALETFPELRDSIADPDETPSLMLLWFELGALARKAHGEGDSEMLRKIYGYASWCFEQRSSTVNNAVSVGFYEHVFDDPSIRESVAPWLNERVVTECWVLWEARFPPKELREIARLVGRKGKLERR